MSINDAYTDVAELCALLQCMGFCVKSLENGEPNIASQDGGTRTVIINCQSSGLHVVLESSALSCSCPPKNSQNSGMWQVTGVTGGKQLDKEFGCTLLGSLPKAHRDRLTTELREIIRCIRQHNESEISYDRPPIEDSKSNSMAELSTPEKRIYQSKIDTPTRYRSLDTLTAVKDEINQPLPAPGPLTKQALANAFNVLDSDKTGMCKRQSTYTLSSTPSSIRRRNKTSSPIQTAQNTILDDLIESEKIAEMLRTKIASIIKGYIDENRNDSSMSSLALDVSKISILKGEQSKAQFASSPNLSGAGKVQEEFLKSRLKRLDSASTSNLAPNKQNPTDKPSRLRRLSPNIFNLKKDSSKTDKKSTENKSSKLNSLFKPKIATPVIRRTESSPMSSSKKKYSHIKSTIPRLTPLKKE
ncbi:hypothetical protein ACJJTC_009657 [Scirpophaga incertulas]